MMRSYLTIFLLISFQISQAQQNDYSLVVDTLSLDTVKIDNVRCKGDASGSISILISGGVEPYSYLWTTSDSLNILSDLIAGNYGLTISDALDSTLVYDFLIDEPKDALSVRSGYNRLDCLDEYEVILGSKGGIGNHTYSLSMDPEVTDFRTSVYFTTTQFGTYYSKVMDSNGCIAIDTFYLSPICSFGGYAVVTHESCHGANDGTIRIVVDGCLSGSAPEYWLSPDNNVSGGGSSNNFSNLTAGIYSLYAASGGCYFMIEEIIVEGPTTDTLALTVASLEHQNCFNDYGKIELITEGGTPPYEFRWNNSNLGTEIDSLKPGNYPMKLTDANDCIIKDTIEIYGKPVFTEDIILNPECPNNPSTQSVNLEFAPNYSFYLGEWLDEDKIFIKDGSTILVEVDSPTAFYISVLDTLNSCVYLDTIDVKANLLSDIDSIRSNPEIQGNQIDNAINGIIDPMITGGVRPYSYSWSTGSTDSILTNIGSGQYLLLVKDVFGCRQNFNFVVENITSIDEIQNEFSIFPNPTNNILSIEGPFDFLELVDVNGQVKFKSEIVNHEITFSISFLPTGLYFIRLISSEGDVYIEEVIINKS